MQGRDAIFDDLEALEEKFEEAAKDTWASLHVRYREMSIALQKMLLIVRREFEKNPSVGGQLVDFVLDFIERPDMIPSLLEADFKNAGSIQRQAIDEQIAGALIYLRSRSPDLTSSYEKG
jgi:hypothetical protein